MSEQDRWQTLVEWSSSYPALCHAIWHVTWKKLGEDTTGGRSQANVMHDKMEKNLIEGIASNNIVQKLVEKKRYESKKTNLS